MSRTLDLLDYRRQVAHHYALVRAGNGSVESWAEWRDARDRLFAGHPQSPIEDPAAFTGLSYFDFEPQWRVHGSFHGADNEEVVVTHSGDGTTSFRRAGQVGFELNGHPQTLDVMWLDGYGGGVFVPFRDATNDSTTYGGGRYLLDTVKGADLGHSGETLVLDFNYAYHPSCVHSPRWSCPLSPPGNTLPIAVTAGERLSG